MRGTDVPDRYELKYVIPEPEVEEVRAAIRPFCRLDAHSEEAPGHRYTIQSLYLDTRRLDLYRVARERRARRFKLRVRGYGARPGDGPVFLEVKERIGALVRKGRARMDAGWADRLWRPVPRSAGAAELAFRDRLERYALEPVLLVRYDREAWESHLDGYARVTFDRRLEVQPWGRMDLDAPPSAWLPLDDLRTLRAVPRAVVLELKCTVDVPRWMARVIERLGLRRVGVSKYCHGVDRVWGSRALPRDLAACAAGDRP
jgi:SPX domain protein involved in polyphosphate accumulation